MTEKDTDVIQRFLFEHHDIRGELVSLDDTWRQMIAFHDYPPIIQHQLGELVAATALLASTLKFEGRLTAQVESSGPLRLMVVQCNDDLKMRAVARFDELGETVDFSELTQDGRLVITIDNKDRAEPYQGLVPLFGHSLAESLQYYFEHSVQLPARMWLHSDDARVVGMLLQKLPEDDRSMKDTDDVWNRVQILADTVKPNELLNLSNQTLITRLFHEDSLRLFEPKSVAFQCSCTREAMSQVLRMLGKDEVDELLAEQGKAEITCEFCNRSQSFDVVDVAALMEPAATPGSTTKH